MAKWPRVVILALAGAGLARTAAAGDRTAVGPNLNILGHQTELTAGTAFHILLGWDPLPTTLDAIGKCSWSLDVDGTPPEADFHVFGPSPIQDDALERAWFFNFPDGPSAGTHTFVTHGFAPCYATSGPCSQSNAVVEAFTITRTVNFT